MRVAGFALPLFVAMGVSGALAQSPSPLPSSPPPSLPGYGDVYTRSSEENIDTRAVRESMVKFARCIARRRPKEANDFVLQVSQATWSALSKRIDESCALEAVDNPGEQVRVSTNSQDLLFALAEVLAQKLLDDADPAAIKAAAPLPLADPLAAVGECAVRANPAGARDLLKTRLNSKEERAALQAMAPAFGSCVPKGTQVRFDRVTMRGAVAVNYYRLAKQPPIGSGGQSQ